MLDILRLVNIYVDLMPVFYFVIFNLEAFLLIISYLITIPKNSKWIFMCESKINNNWKPFVLHSSNSKAEYIRIFVNYFITIFYSFHFYTICGELNWTISFLYLTLIFHKNFPYNLNDIHPMIWPVTHFIIMWICFKLIKSYKCYSNVCVSVWVSDP